MENNNVDVKVQIVTATANVGNWFMSALFIWWGWNVLAPHLNAPQFGYWEIFAMRMAFGCILAMFKRMIGNGD